MAGKPLLNTVARNPNGKRIGTGHVDRMRLKSSGMRQLTLPLETMGGGNYIVECSLVRRTKLQRGKKLAPKNTLKLLSLMYRFFFSFLDICIYGVGGAFKSGAPPHHLKWYSPLYYCIVLATSFWGVGG